LEKTREHLSKKKKRESQTAGSRSPGQIRVITKRWLGGGLDNTRKRLCSRSKRDKGTNRKSGRRISGGKRVQREKKPSVEWWDDLQKEPLTRLLPERE